LLNPPDIFDKPITILNKKGSSMMVEDVKINGEFPELPQDPVDVLVTPLKRFLHIESASGVLLILTTLSALILANSPLSVLVFEG